MHTPYVYSLHHVLTGMRYIGVRYASGCHPDDLWVTYFSSSKMVKSLIRVFGVDGWERDILGEFPNSPVSAILYEASMFETIRGNPKYMNVCYSCGCIDPSINAKAGAVGGSIVKKNGIGIFRSDDDRKRWASLGGKIGAKRQIANKIGIHGQTPEERRRLAVMGGLVGGFTRSDVQSELGKRGGIKNKGFIWYNDGTRDLKYTAKMQDELSFDQFLSQNPTFKKGRGNTNAKNNQYTKARATDDSGR